MLQCGLLPSLPPTTHSQSDSKLPGHSSALITPAYDTGHLVQLNEQMQLASTAPSSYCSLPSSSQQLQPQLQMSCLQLCSLASRMTWHFHTTCIIPSAWSITVLLPTGISRHSTFFCTWELQFTRKSNALIPNHISKARISDLHCKY